MEFLLEVKWMRKADDDGGDVIKYELDADGVVMFDRFSAEGKFRSLPMRKPRLNLKGELALQWCLLRDVLTHEIGFVI